VQDQWFKLKVRANGFAFDAEDNSRKWKQKTPAYLYIGGDNESAYYMIVCEVEPGVWAVVDGSEDIWATFSEGTNYIFSDMDFTFVNPDGSLMFGWTTAIIKMKINRFEELRRAKFRSLGAEVIGGFDASDNSTVLGKAKIKGKLVDPEKLPFDPDNMTMVRPRPGPGPGIEPF
jgi:hypothetical protein